MFKYSVVTLCGSTKFKDKFMEVARQLTLEGYIVLMPLVFHHSEEEPITEEQKEELDYLHKKKIDMCDWVYVINVDNYIGSSTKSEIEYAKSLGTIVRYMIPQDGVIFEYQEKKE